MFDKWNANYENVCSGKQTETVSSDGNVLLRSVVRVGALAKGLLLHDDLSVSLVVLCSEKPTRTLLDTIADRLTKQLQVALLILQDNFFQDLLNCMPSSLYAFSGKE